MHHIVHVLNLPLHHDPRVPQNLQALLLEDIRHDHNV